MVPPLSAVYPLDDEGPIAYLKRQIAIARFSLRTLSAIYQNHQMEIQERATGAETALKSANSTIDDLKTSNVEQTRQIKTQQQIIADKSRIIDEMVAAQALVHSNSIAQEFFGLVAELRSLLDEQASLLLEQNKLLRKGNTMIMVLIDILHEDAATWDGKEKKLSEQIVSLQRVIKEQRTSMAEKVKALDDLAKASASKSTAGSIPPNSPENRQLSDLRQKVAIQGDQIEKLTATITEKKETLESAVAKEFRMSAKIKELKDDISRAKRLEAKLSETVKAREREARIQNEHAYAEKIRLKKDIQGLQHQVEDLGLERINLQTEMGALRDQVHDIERGAEIDKQSCLRSYALQEQDLVDTRQALWQARQASRMTEERQRRLREMEEDGKEVGLALYGDLKLPAPESDDPPLEHQYLQDQLDALRQSNQEMEKKIKTLQARDQASSRVQKEVLECASDFKKTEKPSRHQLSRWLLAFEKVYNFESNAEG